MYAREGGSYGKNGAALNHLPSELYKINANDKIPDNCKYPLVLIEADENQKETDTRGLVKLLKLKIGARLMLTVNIDIQDRLTNGQRGYVSHIEFAQGCVCRIYERLSDEKAGLNAMRPYYLGCQNSCFPIEKCNH